MVESAIVFSASGSIIERIRASAGNLAGAPGHGKKNLLVLEDLFSRILA